MSEGREVATVLDRRFDERLLDPVLAAATRVAARQKIRVAVETALELSEANPEAAREAFTTLRSDPLALQRLEAGLELSPERATLALGAAIQLAINELSTPEPDLRGIAEEMVRWLEGAW